MKTDSTSSKVVAIHVKMPRDMTTAELVKMLNNFLHDDVVKVLQYPPREKV